MPIYLLKIILFKGKCVAFKPLKTQAATVIILLLLINVSQVFAQTSSDFMLNNVLQSNMVIQQNKPFKVWGHAPAGKIITVKADWLNEPVSTSADQQNNFMVVLNVPEVKKGDYKPHQISIKENQHTIIINNLLIGEVWFLSGQSNMQFALKDAVNATEEIVAANHPNIRLLNVGFNWNTMPIDTIKGNWQICSSASAKDFSAVGYYFGRDLQQKLDVPVGLIFSGVGGSWEQAYVPKKVLADDSLLNDVYLQPFLNSPKSKEKINGVFSFDRISQPYLLYNALIYPFLNLSIKGICWYQGESNRAERESYLQLSYAMIKNWREGFAQGNLPFYYVQVAPYAYEKLDPVLNDYAFFREIQEKVSAMANSEMITTMDVGNPKDIHPKNKKPVGERLARTALNRTYSYLDITYLGPHFDYVSYNHREAIVHFNPKTISKGLKTNDGLPPRYFMLAGDDHHFYPAAAVIEGNTVMLISKEVKKPVAVRYAFTNYPITNFENGNGLPAVPFRTDNWPENQ